MDSPRREVATLAGGCFWCLEAVYDELRGVEKVESGYSGGLVSNPTYRQVCTGTTGHAEVVQVTFDPEVVSFREILEVFFTIHDPTTLNRQGADVGPQYRSAVFYHDEEQRRITEEVISKLEAEGVWDDPIVTEVTPFEAFYGRGLSSGVLPEQRVPAVLPGRDRAQGREVPQAVSRETQSLAPPS
jgi:peptide-methionine (S)-S-oxide reductase